MFFKPEKNIIVPELEQKKCESSRKSFSHQPREILEKVFQEKALLPQPREYIPRNLNMFSRSFLDSFWTWSKDIFMLGFFPRVGTTIFFLEIFSRVFPGLEQ